MWCPKLQLDQVFRSLYPAFQGSLRQTNELIRACDFRRHISDLDSGDSTSRYKRFALPTDVRRSNVWSKPQFRRFFSKTIKRRGRRARYPEAGYVGHFSETIPSSGEAKIGFHALHPSTTGTVKQAPLRIQAL